MDELVLLFVVVVVRMRAEEEEDLEEEEEEVEEEEDEDDSEFVTDEEFAESTRLRHSLYSCASFSLVLATCSDDCPAVASNKNRFCLTSSAVCFCPVPTVSKQIAIIEFKTS